MPFALEQQSIGQNGHPGMVLRRGRFRKGWRQLGSGHGDDGDEHRAGQADRRGREGVRPLLVERAERDQPDRSRTCRGRHFYDYDGNRYLDFASQLVNVSIGHSHPKVVQAIKDQADKLATIGPPMATESRSRLGKLLAEVTPGDLQMSFFTNGGAEANENAIKLARWYTGRHKIIARYRSYHGATGGAITLTGDPRRWPAEPGLPGVVRMFDPYTYRCPAGHPDPCPVCSGAPHLEEILQYEGAHTVAAVILETVTGTNGIIVPPDGYLQSIREVCDRHGILLICDEVMAGFGRTGKWFGVDNWDVVPDILTVAKGINSGYVPLGAMVVREADRGLGARQDVRRRPDVQRPSARVCLRVASIEAFQEEGIVEQSAATGEVFRTELAKLAAKPPVDRRGARPRLLLGPRARQEPRDARAARALQRQRRGREADGRRHEACARPRPVSDDALERRHVLPAADDHARRARRGARDPRRRTGGRRRIRRLGSSPKHRTHTWRGRPAHGSSTRSGFTLRSPETDSGSACAASTSTRAPPAVSSRRFAR